MTTVCPALSSGVIEQRLPSRHGNNRHGCSLDVGQRAWLARDHARGSQGVLGVGPDEARVGNAVHRIAHAQPGNPGSHGCNLTGQIRTQREGKRLRQSALAGPDPAVPWSDPSRCDLDQDLAGAGLRPRHALERHDLWGPEFVHAPRHHRRLRVACFTLNDDAAGGHLTLPTPRGGLLPRTSHSIPINSNRLAQIHARGAEADPAASATDADRPIRTPAPQLCGSAGIPAPNTVPGAPSRSKHRRPVRRRCRRRARPVPPHAAPHEPPHRREAG